MATRGADAGTTAEAGTRAAWRHEALTEQLRAMFAAGEYGVGDLLPPERIIAEANNVSRATVREALRTLESQGMIIRRQGSGTQVVATTPQRFSQSIDSLDTLLTKPPDTIEREDAVAQDVLGRKVPCLYGGSVNPQNCEELISCPHVDGLFIGRSAWNVAGYLDILAKCAAKL